MVVEEECLAVASRRAVAEPWLAFIALRTIHGQALVIAQYAPESVAINAVEHGVGTVEMSCLGHFIADYFSDEIVLFCIFQSCHLHISEAVIYKRWVPPLALLVAAGIVAVGALCVAVVLHPDGVAGGVKSFGKSHHHRVAFLQLREAERQPAGHVLAHVEDGFSAYLTDVDGMDFLQHFHVWSHCAAQCSQRNGCPLSFCPRGIVVPRHGPVAQFLPSVVGFAVVFVV